MKQGPDELLQVQFRLLFRVHGELIGVPCCFRIVGTGLTPPFLQYRIACPEVHAAETLAAVDRIEADVRPTVNIHRELESELAATTLDDGRLFWDSRRASVR